MAECRLDPLMNIYAVNVVYVFIIPHKITAHAAC